MTSTPRLPFAVGGKKRFDLFNRILKAATQTALYRSMFIQKASKANNKFCYNLLKQCAGFANALIFSKRNVFRKRKRFSVDFFSALCVGVCVGFAFFMMENDGKSNITRLNRTLVGWITLKNVWTSSIVRENLPILAKNERAHVREGERDLCIGE